MEEGEELLWRVEELSAVRASGLVGALVGCLPRAPRQNTRLGRPLLLRSEEVQLIREEHLLLQPQTRPTGDNPQRREEVQVIREEQLQKLTSSEGQRLLHPKPLPTTDDLLLVQRDKRDLLTEGHLHPRPCPIREDHVLSKDLLLSEEQSRPFIGPTEMPNPLKEVSPNSHREELHPRTEKSLVQTAGPVGSSDHQQGAAGLSRCLKEELTETQELQWEEFLNQSLMEQQRLSLSDRKSAVTSSLAGRVSEAELESRLSSLEQSFLFPRSALTVQLSTCRYGLPLQPITGQDLPLQPITGQDLPLQPISYQQQSPEPMGVRLQVFRDLRRRGFFLTSGGKFGVDFLVYPGDPLRFHAHFMALCLPEGGSLPVAELLSCVRLSSNVKKTLLLCSVSPAEGVVYSSLQWSHMS